LGAHEEVDLQQIGRDRLHQSSRKRSRRLRGDAIDGNVEQLTYGGAGHVMGTYRMGDDPKTSVATEEWAEAVITEIRTELLPAIISLKLEPGEKIDTLSDLARQVAVDMRLTLSIAHSREFFEHELDQLERLDARISRLVKDLVQMKAMKQMLRQTSME
jgi:hypothetical protein